MEIYFLGRKAFDRYVLGNRRIPRDGLSLMKPNRVLTLMVQAFSNTNTFGVIKFELYKILGTAVSNGSVALAFQTTPDNESPCRSGGNLATIKKVITKSRKDPNDDRRPITEEMLNVAIFRFFKVFGFAIAVFSGSASFANDQIKCGDAKSLAAIQKVIEKAGDMSGDSRLPITVGGPKLGISQAEIAQVRENTGLVRCDGLKEFSQGSATLIGDGSHILTAAHLFIDQTGKPRESNLSCTFTTQAPKPQIRKINIKLSDPKLVEIGKNYPKDPWGDYAVIALDKPISGTNPIPINLTDKTIKNSQKTFVVSALQVDRMNFDRKQPLVENCEIFDQEFHIQASAYSNHCRCDRGCSGGGQFARAPNGELFLSAMIVHGGTGGDSESIAVDANVLSTIRQMDPSITEGKGGIHAN